MAKARVTVRVSMALEELVLTTRDLSSGQRTKAMTDRARREKASKTEPSLEARQTAAKREALSESELPET